MPFSDLLLDRLEQGKISIREALEQPRLWVVDVDNNNRPVQTVRTTLANLPQDVPVHGTLLLPSLEPASLMERRVRLVGRVRELDADLLRFELRDLEGPVARRLCFFDAGLWHDMRDLLGEVVRVEVGGVEESAAGPAKVTFFGKLAG